MCVVVNLALLTLNCLFCRYINLLDCADPQPPPLDFVTKNPDGNILGTKRGIIDTLVQKKFLKTNSKNKFRKKKIGNKF